MKVIPGKPTHGEIVFKDQREQTLERWSVLPGVAADHEVRKWMDREFFEANIDGKTCTAKWYAGERMDWQMAVSALFPSPSSPV